MSQKMRCRPSALLGLTDTFVSFCTDRAVFTLAMTIENEQEEAEGRLPDNAKQAAHTRARQRVLDQYLGVQLSEQPERFRAIG